MNSITVLGKEDLVPQQNNSYIITDKGLCLRKNTGIIDAIIPVDSVPILKNVDCYAKLNIPKISVEILCQVISFFKESFFTIFSEAIVLIDYNTQTRQFIITVPKQKVRSGHAQAYDIEAQDDDLLRIGTIHSHCNFSAFHSITDVGDESDEDGLHITIGNVNSEEYSIACTVQVLKKRFQVHPTEYLDGVVEIVQEDLNRKYWYPKYKVLADKGLFHHPTEWIKLVEYEPIQQSKYYTNYKDETGKKNLASFNSLSFCKECFYKKFYEICQEEEYDEEGIIVDEFTT